MFDTSPENMWEELEASRQQCERRLFARAEMIARYHGPFYEDGVLGSGSEPENPAFEWIATVGAQIIAGDPACNVRATRADLPNATQRAQGMRYSLNRLARDGDDKRRYRKLWVDWCFGPAITCVWPRVAPFADKGPLDGPVHRPDMRRVSPIWQRHDARATDWEDTLWRGHGIITSQDELLELAKADDSWDAEAIDGLTTEVGLDKFVPKEGMRLRGRSDFILWMVWFPTVPFDEDLGPQDGFFGSIEYFAQSQKGKRSGDKNTSPLVSVRKRQPWKYSRQGPYFMSGQHYVPDRVHPLAIMVAIENIARSLRLQSRVIDDAMQNYKRFVIEGTGEKHLGLRLKNVRHGGILRARGFVRGQAQEFTIGGIDAAMDAMYRFRLEQMDRRSGLTDAMKGQVSAGTTATAETIAQGGANARLSGLRDEFYSFVRDNFTARAQIIDQDDRFYMPIPPELQKQLGTDKVGLRGGRSEGESFEDYELAIEPLSMKHRSEEELAMAAERELAMFAQIGPLAIQAPVIDWTGVLQDVADATGQTQLPERFNANLANQIAALMLQNTLQPQGTGQPAQGTVRGVGDSGSQGRAMLTTPAQRTSAGPAQPPGGKAPRQSVAGASSGAKAGGRAKSKAKAGAY